MTEAPCWMIKSQFVKLEPFEGENGIKTLLKVHFETFTWKTNYEYYINF